MDLFPGFGLFSLRNFSFNDIAMAYGSFFWGVRCGNCRFRRSKCLKMDLWRCSRTPGNPSGALRKVSGDSGKPSGESGRSPGDAGRPSGESFDVPEPPATLPENLFPAPRLREPFRRILKPSRNFRNASRRYFFAAGRAGSACRPPLGQLSSPIYSTAASLRNRPAFLWPGVE